MSLLLILTIVTILIILLLRIVFIEHFNNLDAKIALYDQSNRCPFDYIKLYEDSSHNNKFVVESKLNDKPKSLDLIFDSVDEYADTWNQMKHIFPDITKCGNPYEKYLDNVRTYYQNQKFVPVSQDTTTPLYTQENFNGTMKVDLPSIYTNDNINVRQLTRTTDNSSQMNSAQYMKPNTPNTRGHEQIDTSVEPHNDMVPITYTDKNMQLLKNQMMDSNFEQQRSYQKQILQMNNEIDQLRREIESLREQLVYEKSHFENLDKTIEEKHQKIIEANKLNVDLLKKFDNLNQRNIDLENLYLQSDAHKNTLEVRLKSLRDSAEEDVKNKGYTIMPPTHWTMNQWRPPICRGGNGTIACPISSTNPSGNYADVFSETMVKNTDLFTHREIPADPIDYKNES